MLFSFTACDNSADNKSGKDNSQSANKIPVNQIKITASDAEIHTAELTNISLADNLTINVPNQLDYMGEFTAAYVPRLSNSDAYEEFKEIFKTIFPGREFNDDYLRYFGENSRIDENNSQLKTIKENFDKIMSGEENVLYYLYEDENYEDGNDGCSLEFTSPFGNELVKFSKGKSVKLFGKLPEFGEYFLNESFTPQDNFEYIETLNTDSDKVYKLLDKEISVKDAVDFAEEYLNKFEYSGDVVYDIKAVSVDVYKVDDDCYGYQINTTQNYKGVNFDYIKSGILRSGTDDYDFIIGQSFMVESNDIDLCYGAQRLADIFDEEKITEVVDFSSAIKISSELLSNEVNFELNKIELVYALSKVKEQVANPEDYRQKISPAWKFTFINPSDGFTYVAFVDAENGENFRYYMYQIT
jgi:hypothetical protein